MAGMDMSWLLQQASRLGTGQWQGGTNTTTVNGVANYGGGTHIAGDDPNSKDNQARLAQLMKYDPSASIQHVDGPDQGDGGHGPGGFNFVYDSSKLPDVPKGAKGEVMGAYFNQQQLGSMAKDQYNRGADTVEINRLKDPSNFVDDSLWGRLTPESNYSESTMKGKTSWLDIVGPMVPMLFAGAMNPGLMSTMGGRLTDFLAKLPQMAANQSDKGG